MQQPHTHTLGAISISRQCSSTRAIRIHTISQHTIRIQPTHNQRAISLSQSNCRNQSVAIRQSVAISLSQSVCRNHDQSVAISQSQSVCRNQSVATTLSQSVCRNQPVAITLLQSTFSRASLAGVDQPDPAPLLQALLSPHALQALLSPRRASCERTGLQQRTQLQADLSIYDDLNLRHQAPMSRGKPHYLQQELECWR
jgi:hypothetical protein